MKKFLTLTLVLVMALGLAVPALAYTNNVALQQGVSPYTVDIYLVEHTSGDWLSAWLSMPPSDRGYAKNEIVAAIGSVTIPANYDVVADFYQRLAFIPTNVSLEVTDNYLSGTTDYGLTTSFPSFGTTPRIRAASWSFHADSKQLRYDITATNAATYGVLPVVSRTETYRALVFAKVTADDAKLGFSLSRGAGFVATGAAAAAWYAAAPYNAYFALAVNPTMESILVLNEDLLVYRATDVNPGPNIYYVFQNSVDGFGFAANATPGDLLFKIETGARGKTLRLYMYPSGAGGTEYRIHVEPSTQELVFIITSLPTGAAQVNDQIKFGTAGYSSLLAFYKDYFEGKLNFTAYNEGNLMNAGDWGAIAAAAWDITETVDIEPWTPYVSVPDNIVQDPPKTGDASILGFVLIALAGAAAVVVRKVRA